MGYHAYEPFITDLSTAATMKLKPRMVTTGDALVIYPNSTDTVPSITLTGAGYLVIDLGANQALQLKEGGTAFATFSELNNFTIASTSNKDIAILPNGTGSVKFGTHSALAGESLSGYITIKDSGGTARKLGVIS